jgi:hypothetical protein
MLHFVDWRSLVSLTGGSWVGVTAVNTFFEDGVAIKVPLYLPSESFHLLNDFGFLSRCQWFLPLHFMAQMMVLRGLKFREESFFDRRIGYVLLQNCNFWRRISFHIRPGIPGDQNEDRRRKYQRTESQLPNRHFCIKKSGRCN